MLMLLDLDNTLVDRDAAFRGAVAAFLAEQGLPGADLAWVMEADASGYTPRDVLAEMMADRFGPAAPQAAVRMLLDRGAADRVVLDRAVEDALVTARENGWTCVIVTNGRVAQQEAKIRNTGLDRLVHGWVVSEAVGCKKPAPEIFRAAASVAGLAIDGAWVVGDSAHADIAGAVASGLPSVWVSAGREWAADGFRPTHVTENAAAAIRIVVTGGPGVSEVAPTVSQ